MEREALRAEGDDALRGVPEEAIRDVVVELYTAGRLALSDLEPLFPDVNRRSLQRDLKKLLEKGLLREIGSGPTDPNRHYVPGEL